MPVFLHNYPVSSDSSGKWSALRHLFFQFAVLHKKHYQFTSTTVFLSNRKNEQKITNFNTLKSTKTHKWQKRVNFKTLKTTKNHNLQK